MIRSIFLLVLITCFYSNLAKAQTPVADLTQLEVFSGGGLVIGGGAFERHGFMVMDQDDNLVIVGNYTNNNSQNKRPIIYQGDTIYSDMAYREIVLIQLDKSGTIIWNKRIRSTYLIQVIDVVSDQGNNTNIVFENYQKCVFEGLEFDPGQYILQIDQAGAYKWHNKISGMRIESLTRDCADNIIVSGNTTWHSTVPLDTLIFGTDTIVVYQQASDSVKVGSQIFPPVGERNLILLKFDASGDFLWQKQFPGRFQTTVISATYSEEIVLAGMFLDSVYIDSIFLSPVVPGNQHRSFCMKADAFGAVLWAHAYFDGSFTQDIQMAPDGSIYVGLSYYLTTVFDNNQFQSYGVHDILLSKLSNDGFFEWASSVGGPNSDLRCVLSVNKKGDVAISGYSFNSGEQVRKFDKTGSVNWAIPDGPGAGNQGSAECVFDRHGDMWQIGWFNGDFELGPYNYSIWGGPIYTYLSKYVDQDTSGTAPECKMVSNAPLIQPRQFGILPNPASDWIHFVTTSKITKIQIYSALGDPVIQCTGTCDQINLGSLHDGIYFAVAGLDSGAIVTAPFLIFRG